MPREVTAAAKILAISPDEGEDQKIIDLLPKGFGKTKIGKAVRVMVDNYLAQEFDSNNRAAASIPVLSKGDIY